MCLISPSGQPECCSGRLVLRGLGCAAPVHVSLLVLRSDWTPSSCGLWSAPETAAFVLVKLAFVEFGNGSFKIGRRVWPIYSWISGMPDKLTRDPAGTPGQLGRGIACICWVEDSRIAMASA